MSGSGTTGAALQEHWAPLLRRLTAHSGRFDLTEEALADAFEEAVRAWGESPPDNRLFAVEGVVEGRRLVRG